MHRLGIARDQRVPPGQILLLMDQFVGAGFRQPIDAAEISRGQLHAIRHDVLAIGVVLAAAAAKIELLAGDIGEQHLVGIGIAQLDRGSICRSRRTGSPTPTASSWKGASSSRRAAFPQPFSRRLVSVDERADRRGLMRSRQERPLKRP